MLRHCLVAIYVIVIVIVVELWCHSSLCPPYGFIYIHNDDDDGLEFSILISIEDYYAPWLLPLVMLLLLLCCCGAAAVLLCCCGAATLSPCCSTSYDAAQCAVLHGVQLRCC